MARKSFLLLLALAFSAELSFVGTASLVRLRLRLRAEPAPESKKAEEGRLGASEGLRWSERRL